MAAIPFRDEVLRFLAGREMVFNEEYHLLASGSKPVLCLPADGFRQGHGWFLTLADTGAGEWNLARAFGPPDLYAPLTEIFPPDQEFHLLVPQGDGEILRSLGLPPAVEELICHAGPEPTPAEKDTNFPDVQDVGEGLVFRFLHRETAAGESVLGPRAYLLQEDSIVTLVKTIHVTPNTLEVYIETAPHCRNRGLATFLLREFHRRILRSGRRLIYVTSHRNAGSLRVAAKAGLTPYQTLLRIPFVG